jgi:hypothetical protein
MLSVQMTGPLGISWYAAQEFDANDLCPVTVPVWDAVANRWITSPEVTVPCDLSPGPRTPSAKELDQWKKSLYADWRVRSGTDIGAYGALKTGRYDFRRYRDYKGNLVGKFYDDRSKKLTIKPISGTWLTKIADWVADNACSLAAGGVAASGGNIATAGKVKAACDALRGNVGKPTAITPVFATRAVVAPMYAPPPVPAALPAPVAPVAPVVPVALVPAPRKYPPGSIAAFDPKISKWLIAIPVGTSLSGTLGEDPTHKVAEQAPTLPADVPPVTLDELQRTTGTRPWYRKPGVWVGIGVGVLVIGGGTAVVVRRRRTA